MFQSAEASVRGTRTWPKRALRRPNLSWPGNGNVPNADARNAFLERSERRPGGGVSQLAVDLCAEPVAEEDE